MADHQERKKEIRREALRNRINLSEEQYHSFSDRIKDRVLGLDEVKRSEIIHIYSAMESRYEVRTAGLIKSFLDSGRKVVVPVMEFGTGRTLRHVYVTGETRWKSNRWGVNEPESGAEASPDDPDIVLVPVVAADLKLNRIGYGKGYYDTFLSETGITAAGLVFEVNVYRSLPAEPHDKQLDLLITEDRVIRK